MPKKKSEGLSETTIARFFDFIFENLKGKVPNDTLPPSPPSKQEEPKRNLPKWVEY